MDVERRYAEFRATEDGRTLSGRALVYGDVSPQFQERFVPGAFGSIEPVPLNLQHDPGMILVNAAGLALIDSERALEVRATLPPQSAAVQLVKRGALRGFSIEFHAREERREAGIRVIEKATLTGVALVDDGAYPLSRPEVRASAHGYRRVWL